MTNYPYTRDLPVANNDPSVDQPLMTQNTNSIDSLIDEDHYSFGENNGGFHRQVRIPNLAAIPGGLIGMSSTLYAKQANTQSQVFYTNGASGNEYQLTRADNTNYSTFGLFPAIVYTPNSENGSAGWTFLPGGIRLQYGTITVTTTKAYTIDFPIAFSQLFIVIPIYQNSTGASISGQLKTSSDSSFTFEVYGSSGVVKQINWMAIGL
jgi:hypothetical protein